MTLLLVHHRIWVTLNQFQFYVTFFSETTILTDFILLCLRYIYFSRKHRKVRENLSFEQLKKILSVLYRTTVLILLV